MVWAVHCTWVAFQFGPSPPTELSLSHDPSSQFASDRTESTREVTGSLRVDQVDQQPGSPHNQATVTQWRRAWGWAMAVGVRGRDGGCRRDHACADNALVHNRCTRKGASRVATGLPHSALMARSGPSVGVHHRPPIRWPAVLVRRGPLIRSSHDSQAENAGSIPVARPPRTRRRR